MDDGPHHEIQDDRNGEVRSDCQKSELPSGPLWGDPGFSNVCPNQAQLEGLPMGITTDQTEGSVERVGEAMGHASPRDKPERKASAPTTPATLHQQTLAKRCHSSYWGLEASLEKAEQAPKKIRIS